MASQLKKKKKNNIASYYHKFKYLGSSVESNEESNLDLMLGWMQGGSSEGAGGFCSTITKDFHIN